MDEEKLSPELKEKLLEVELEAARDDHSLPRFDKDKAILVGLFCFGLAFTLGIAMRTGAVKSLIFGVIVGGIGFATAGFQRPKKK
ncbi:MAG: hypothetical protein E7058_04080 [Lentisphaerae bacterium]|nr:hypothetical protein [Lentisphaerota bacterium]